MPSYPDPFGVAPRGLDGCFDERNPLGSILAARQLPVLFPTLPAIALRPCGTRHLRVNIGNTLEIAFRMARRDAGHARRCRSRTRSAAGDEPLGFAERRKPQIVR